MSNTPITTLYPKPASSGVLKFTGETDFQNLGQNDSFVVPDANKIIQLYEKGFDNTTALILRAHSNNIVDATVKNSLGLYGGVVSVGTHSVDTVAGYSGFGNSIYFDGTGDYVSTQNIEFGSNDFTIEFWAQFKDSVAQESFMGTGLTGRANKWMLSINAFLSGHATFHTNTTLSDSQVVNFPWTPSVNTWYHIALSKQSNNLRLFVNGAQIGTTQSYTASIPISGQDFKIGRDGEGYRHFNGYLDEVIITNGIAKYVSNFTVANTPALPNATAWSLLTPNLDWVTTDATLIYPKTSVNQYPQGNTIQKLKAGFADIGVVYI